MVVAKERVSQFKDDCLKTVLIFGIITPIKINSVLVCSLESRRGQLYHICNN